MGLNSGFFRIILLVFFFFFIVKVRGTTVFDVTKFGAIPDGVTDNVQAFGAAWKASCEWQGRSEIYIPSGTFVLGPIEFKGPCKSQVGLAIDGVIKARRNEAAIFIRSWINIRYIDHMLIHGSGTLDGQGNSAWDRNNCSIDPHCPPFAATMRLENIRYAIVRDITSLDSKNFHFVLFECTQILLQNLTIIAPGNSVNTDGIHIGKTDTINITNSNISTGDDIISLGPGSKNINITNIRSWAGHGISIGSLGGSPNEDEITGIRVRNCNLSNTMNGIRIKTKGHFPGNVYDITYEDINVNNVRNPIIIDQLYCGSAHCEKETSQVKIRDVRFRNIWGTTNARTPMAVNFICSTATPCENIELRDINLSLDGGQPTKSSCSNAKGVSYGRQLPPSCLQA